ncbi:MAG TPA: extracellular solute-binding protein [Firmicutes bacterium]|nr:extracellular solute-binding protein [Bacillota bacterium]
MNARTKRLTGWAAVLALLMAFPLAPAVRADEELPTEIIQTDEAGVPETDYAAYLQEKRENGWKEAADSHLLQPQDALLEGASLEDGVLVTGESGYAEWRVEVPEAALYQLKITYKGEGNDVSAMERSISVNGEVPFSQAQSVSFSRVWLNSPEEMDGDAFRADINGNQITPTQVPEDEWTEQYAEYTEGEWVTPYFFALEKGQNTIRLSGVRGTMRIQSVSLEVSKGFAGVTYEEYQAAHSGSEYTGETLVIQGENAERKSASTLVPLTDRSSPATQPSNPTTTCLNTIGGSGWSSPGQWIEWTVEVPQAGFYALGLKFRQNLVSGMFTTRSLSINGEVPFEEMAALEFSYSGKWQGRVLSDEEGEPYQFYLREGENTIRLQVAAGRAAGLFARAEESVRRLNEAYRQIIMLTSTSPDPLRNYRIDKVLPEVMEIFREQAEELKALSEGIAAISGEKGSVNTTLDNLQLQLESFLEKPISIPSRLDTFKTNVSSMASWVYELASQPLEIDYLTLSAPSKGADIPEVTKVNAGFFQKLAYELRAFIGSYTADYTGLGGTAENTAGRVLDIWVNSGRDQASIIKKLADNRFTPETGIGVSIKITSSATTTVTSVSSLLMATVSGVGPDLAMSLANTEPVNYATRGAAVDLSQFEGFDEVIRRFMPSALEPYEYQGGTYALPETQGFAMMFYRTDILEELGITPPETWDDLYTVIGELQKKYMTVGIPGDISYLATRIYQDGGSLYNEDKSRSLLGEQEALTQFRDWTNLYTSYSLQLDYDAANQFRTGEMPIVISDYSFFNRMSVLAPELKGMWDFQEIPGTLREDGTIDTTAASTGTSTMMLATTEMPEEAWEFMRWWSSEEIQSEYGRQLESLMGVSARLQSANVEAMQGLPWKQSELRKLTAQWENTRGIPEIPGSYYVSRNVDNALRNVINYGTDPQEVLKEYALTINEEIASKRHEFGLE